MGEIFGYGRRSLWKRALPIVAQREAIVAYVTERGCHFDPAARFFADVPSAHEQDFSGRPAGRVLWDRLGRGDGLVVTSLDRLFFRAPDCGAVLGLWERLGVALHIVELGGPVYRLGASAMAWAMASIEKAARSERAAVSAAKSKYVGRPVNGSPPYGFRWIHRPGGEWELVADEEERVLMKAMLRWHEAGHSIDQIRWNLAYRLKLEFYKQRGRSKRLVRWNNDAIWRRIQAEKRLQQQEAESATPT
jgi:DNA invertase Pin-like site-specific DNA recombinase